MAFFRTSVRNGRDAKRRGARNGFCIVRYPPSKHAASADSAPAHPIRLNVFPAALRSTNDCTQNDTRS
jgi:hypothetical protein